MSELSQDLSYLAGGWAFTSGSLTQPIIAPPPALTATIALANPLRWGIIFSVPSNSASPWTVSVVNGTGNRQGIPIPVGGSLQLQFRAWGGLVQREWFGAADGGGGGTINVLEVLAQQ